MRDTLNDLLAVLVAITGLAMTTLVLDACGSGGPATSESIAASAAVSLPTPTWTAGGPGEPGRRVDV